MRAMSAYLQGGRVPGSGDLAGGQYHGAMMMGVIRSVADVRSDFA